jgi:hypothetical protein
MKLKSNVIRELAKMIVGVEPYTDFPEHSEMSDITSYDFFEDINLSLSISGPNNSYNENEYSPYAKDVL